MASTTWHEAQATLLASIRSVGTACTLATVGIYLQRRGFILGQGKRTLALISQQVTIPLFLFTRLVYCNQDWSNDPCPDITSSLKDTWYLLLWPAYVVAVGLLVGHLAARISRTPPYQRRSVLAACAFGNSTGLPITLLSVVHSAFPSTTELGRIDPTMFLSVYLLLYPVLQWSIGGWLLAPSDNDHQDENDDTAESAAALEMENGYMMTSRGQQTIQGTAAATSYQHQQQVVSQRTTLNNDEKENSALSCPSLCSSSSRPYLNRNVLNSKAMANWYRDSRRGLAETDASGYISNADLVHLVPIVNGDNDAAYSQVQQLQPLPEMGLDIPPPPVPSEHAHLLQQQQPPPRDNNGQALSSTTRSLLSQEYETESCWLTLSHVLDRSLQPPVIGAVLGFLVAATPLRGIFVDIVDRDSDAPLQWFFDGLYAVGQAAVPINMIILGCNLSISTFGETPKSALLSQRTMLAICIGKLLIMPIIGIVSVVILRLYDVWDNIPDEIDSSFYLVCMIVFLTPTANNVMVMIELSGMSGTPKEGIARVIAWQYAVAPIILSFTMAVAVGVASHEW